jgi:uncharacterized protein
LPVSECDDLKTIVLKKVIIFLIKLYKRFISPLLPNSCRFYPTCSQYAIDSIKKYGVFKGGVKAAYRIIRCNPFNRGGYDPVK